MNKQTANPGERRYESRTSQITNHPSQKIEKEKFLFFFSLSKFQSVVYYPPTQGIRLPWERKRRPEIRNKKGRKRT